MKTPFKLLSLGIAGCCLLGSYTSHTLAAALPAAGAITSVPVAALISDSQIQVNTQAEKEQSDEITASLNLPVISGLKDTTYQTKLNSKIAETAAKDLEAIRTQAKEGAEQAKQNGYEFRPYSLDVSYEVMTNANHTLSIKVTSYFYTGGAHGMSRIDTYNVADRDQAAAISLSDLFGSSYKDVINKHIKEEITKNPEQYFPDAFQSISDDQIFYLKDGKAYIVFSEYEIAPYAAGSPEFAVSIPDVKSNQEAVQVTSTPVHQQFDQLKVDMDVPVISGMKDTKYQAELNEQIASHAAKDLESMKEQAQKDAEEAKKAGFDPRPYELLIKYEVKSDGSSGSDHRLSIQMITYTYTGGAHGGTRIDNYNVINSDPAEKLELSSLFGEHFKETINKQIEAEIAKQPEKYFEDGFKGISDSQSFYIEQGDAVIVFSQYEIAPYSSGSPEFRIAIPKDSSGKEEAIPTKLMVNGQELPLLTDENGTAFAPLRAVAGDLGFKLQWNAEKMQAEINKGAQWTAVTVGKDAYTYNKMAPISLGAAPFINEEGSLYVPVSFFDRILKAEVSTEADTLTIGLK
ncbi:PdaC/SigV domain-containing protein [Paenibacillus sp. OAS669]|uniref:PdaC/SigV domain-containing protein n=1 Tax=Paenibacillus sp. OAS669 TaxID=2663821 RepID=UPI00178C05E2|nr:DUF4163 domain-containing protein [Paenibacillus sp. OAS669]MBE1443159.1 flagellar biosynthesis/type III secretory pathway protein FliH [Paenibacillus sp. OAS669]